MQASNGVSAEFELEYLLLEGRQWIMNIFIDFFLYVFNKSMQMAKTIV